MLSNGAVNAAYNASVTATGGTTPYAWSATGLPAGLQIDSMSGLISGTPTTSGMSTVAAAVTDSTNPMQTANANFSMTILSSGKLFIATNSLPNGIVNLV